MDLLQNPLIKALLRLELPAEHYVVAGSGPLLAHGLLASTSDLDVVATGPAWARATVLGNPEPAPFGQVNRVLLAEEHIEIFDDWFPDIWSAEHLVRTAEVIQGIRFIPLETVRIYKKRLGREKDIEHVRLIDEFLARRRG